MLLDRLGWEAAGDDSPEGLRFKKQSHWLGDQTTVHNSDCVSLVWETKQIRIDFLTDSSSGRVLFRPLEYPSITRLLYYNPQRYELVTLGVGIEVYVMLCHSI